MPLYLNDTSRYRVQIELDYGDPENSATGTEYVSNFDLQTEANSAPYRAILLNSVSIDQRVDSVGFGTIKVAKHSDMDAWLTREWRGYDVKIYVYVPESTTQTTWFFGVNGGIKNTSKEYIEFELKDKKGAFDTLLLTNKMFDSNINTQRPVPMVLGDVYNIQPEFFGDKYRVGVTKCYFQDARDNGATIDTVPKSVQYASDTGTVSDGMSSDGTIEPVNQLFGTMTVDVNEEHDTCGKQMEFFAGRAGFEIDAGSFAAFTNNVRSGFYWTDTKITIRQAMDEVCSSAVAFWYVDDTSSTNKIYLKKLALPDDTSEIDVEIKADDIIDHSLRLVEVKPASSATRYHYRRNYHPLKESEIAESVIGTTRQQLKAPWRINEQQNPKGAFYPQAEPFDCFHNTWNDDFMGQRWGIRNATTYVYELKTNKTPELGDHVNITYPSDNFNSGRNARVIGIKKYVDSPILTIRVWVGAAVVGVAATQDVAYNQLVLKWFVDIDNSVCQALDSVTLLDLDGNYAESDEASGDINAVSMPVAGHTNVTFPDFAVKEAGLCTLSHGTPWRLMDCIINGTSKRQAGEWRVSISTPGSGGGYAAGDNFKAGYDPQTGKYVVVIDFATLNPNSSFTSFSVCAEETDIPTTDHAGVVNSLTPNAFYRFNESSSSTWVDSTGSFDGTYYNSPTQQVAGLAKNQAAPNRSVTFDGVNQYATTSLVSVINEFDFTISVLVKVQAGVVGCLMSQYRGGFAGNFVMRINVGGIVDIEIDGNRILRAQNYPLKYDATHHIAVVRSGTDVTLYLNGANVASGTYSGGIVGEDFHVATLNTVSEYLAATVDELATFNSALTAANISSLHSAANVSGGYEDHPSYYNQVVKIGDLEAYFRLGESSGTALTDETGNHTNISYVNSPTLGVDKLMNDNDTDTAVTFSGTSHAYGSEGVWPSSGSYSFAFLMNRTDNTNPNNGIISNHRAAWGANVSLQYNGSGKIEFTHGGSNVFTGATTLTDGTTYHIVLTYDGTTYELFVNGVSDGSGTGTGAHSEPRFYIGTYSNAAGEDFQGTIDELALFSKQLSQTEITNLYNASGL